MIIRSEKYITNPTVACSIIVYNQKDYIGRCIEGMLEQKCDFTFNIVISDDCSTDGTQEVLKDYQARYPEIIKLVLNDRNGGIASNWVNCCKAMEGGEFIAFCDGDDYWSLPQKLQLQYDYLRSHPDCVGVTTDCDSIDENGVVRHAAIEDAGGAQPTVLTQIQVWEDSVHVNPGGMFFRKEPFDRYMPFDAFVEYDFPFQDWPALLVMAGHGVVHKLPISSYTYRIGHVSDSHPDDIAKLERRMKRGEKMYWYLHTLFPALPYSEDDYKNYITDIMLKFCIKSGDYRNAKRYARLSKHKSFRVLCCYSYVSFHMFRAVKKMVGIIR